MVDWNKKFKTQYDAAATALKQKESYAGDWRDLVKKLNELMGAGGFDADREVALGQLRSQITTGPRQTRVTEDKGILAGVGWSEGATVDVATKRRAAALKFLRHVYLLNKAGNHKVWVHSLPVDFTDWPTPYLESHGSSVDAVKNLLRSDNEHFSAQQKRFLGNSTQQAMAWCQKASMVLAKAGPGSGGADTTSRALVSRWFAESGLADATLNTYISTLDQGFKKIIAALNKGHFIVTDWVPFRGASGADELSFLASEAFTFRSQGEGLDVVYIESNFFVDNPGNVLTGQANWTRIVVHELSHLACGTIDVNNGNARYAWYGIGPHAGYPGSDCVRNADNWAFFAADCAGALTDAQRTVALKIV